MTIKDEFLFDFAIRMPRVLVSGNTVIVDNVKKVVLLSPTQVIVHHGQRFTSLLGQELLVRELKDERMLITGEVEQVRFYGALQTDSD